MEKLTKENIKDAIVNGTPESSAHIKLSLSLIPLFRGHKSKAQLEYVDAAINLFRAGVILDVLREFFALDVEGRERAEDIGMPIIKQSYADKEKFLAEKATLAQEAYNSETKDVA